MNCINCYQEIPEGTKFCPHCGAQQPVQSAPTDTAANTTDSAAQGNAYTQQMGAQSEQTGTQQEVPPVSQPQPEYQNGPTYQGATGESGAPNYQGSTAGYTSSNGQEGAGYQSGTAYQGGAGYQNGQGYQSQTSYQPSYQEKPVNWVPYLVLAIISTICCCPPFGIVGIVFAAKINGAVSAGNIEEAKNAAKKAKIWIIVAFAAGFIANLIVFFLGMAGEFSGYYYY